MVEEVVMLHDHTGLVVDVERQVHVREPFDELLEHDGRGFAVPCVHVTSSFDLCDLAVPDHDGDERIVEPDRLPRSFPDDVRFQRPKGQQLVVYRVIFVYQLDPPLLREIVPLVKVRWRWQLVPPAVFCHGVAEGPRLTCSHGLEIPLCPRYELVDRMEE